LLSVNITNIKLHQFTLGLGSKLKATLVVQMGGVGVGVAGVSCQGGVANGKSTHHFHCSRCLTAIQHT
jgi:hypothetical protein